MSGLPDIKLPNTQQILTFYVQGWKTERDGKKMNLPVSDDVYVHADQGSISDTMDQILKAHGLTASDVISITPSRPTDKQRDIGSWDFWMFCRNPNAAPKA